MEKFLFIERKSIRRNDCHNERLTFIALVTGNVAVGIGQRNYLLIDLFGGNETKFTYINFKFL